MRPYERKYLIPFFIPEKNNEKEVQEPKKLWVEIVRKLPQVITVLISLATFYFGVVQFYYSENLIDRRKYVNRFYDERYKTLTELAVCSSDIYTLILKTELSDTDKENIEKKRKIFNYATLVLDKDQEFDKNLMGYIKDFQNCMNHIINKRPELPCLCSKEKLGELNFKILEESSKIFSYEKDRINSFHFKFNPFSED